MALTSLHLTHPNGRILPDMFPEWSASDLDQAIRSWLDDAYLDPRVIALASTAEQDRAAKVWAYHRAFDAAAIAMAANPNSATLNDAGSVTYSKDQRDTFRRLAAEALSEFDQLAPRIAGDYRTGGMTVTHDFAW